MFEKKHHLYRVVISDSKHEREHFHNEIELICVISGSMTVYVEKSMIQLSKENMIVVNTNEHHSHQASDDILYCSIYVSYQKVCDLLEIGEINFVHELPEGKLTQDLRTVVHQILNYQNSAQTRPLYAYSLYYQMMDILTCHFSREMFQYTKGKNQERNAKINNYIRNNYNKQITLNDLAKRLFISDAYLSRYFKQTYGMGFAEYLGNVRMHHALDDIEHTDKILMEVALRNGFSNVSAFNKKFKQLYNMTPSEYRKNLKKEVKDTEKTHAEAQRKFKKIYGEQTNHFENSKLITEKVISVDMHAVQMEMSSKYKLINIGAAEDLLKSKIRCHVCIIREKIGMDYARIWNPFSEEMMIGCGQEDYNFSRLDDIIDFLLEYSIKPFIDLGRKPKRIQKEYDETILFRKDMTGKEDLYAWSSILREWMKHLEERYGKQEVEKWYFELWCDEERRDENGIKAWCEQFNIMYEIIKEYFPNVMVGGYGISTQKIRMKENLRLCGQSKHTPDFFSMYMYAYRTEEENDKTILKRLIDEKIVEESLCKIKDILMELGFQDRPLIISEWGLTVSERNSINDMRYKAAYLVKNMISNYDKGGMWGYFVGSDLFSEYSDTKYLLFGANGLLTKDGILKPSAHAMKFICQMGEWVVSKGENYLITKDAHGTYHILCVHYNALNYRYYVQKEHLIDVKKDYEYYDDRSILNLHFNLRKLKKGKYQIKMQTVNADGGSVADEWRKMNYSTRLTKSDIAYLQNISCPRITIRDFDVNEGSIEFFKAMEPQEISYMEFRRIS